MTKNAAFIQGCIVIFAVLLCYVRTQDMERKKRAEVNCERQPYHYTCRGKMSRKRAMATRFMQELECEDADQDFGCIKFNLPGEVQRHGRHGPLSKSKLWIGLLNDISDLQRDARLHEANGIEQEAQRETSSEDRAIVYDRQRVPMLEALLSRLESMEQAEKTRNADADY
ncbi:hypothetical protein KM043_001012 [Ampulex compressa]|nr:hypothetical protein KM043_001012 [Ampulex compressa]